MLRATRARAAALVATLCLALPAAAPAGPPYVTDDPEPVDYQHWEVYLASQVAHDKDGWAGTGPHLEVNYGVLPDVQLHLIAPLVFQLPAEGTGRYGYGDTEVGVKYRFVYEDTWTPMVGVFPIVLLPSGDERNGLGTGHVLTFLPLWIQKSVSEWTTYGGGGYWIVPGAANRNFWLTGWQLQRHVTDWAAVGVEVFHTTPQERGGPSETRFNAGLLVDFSERHHLLFSAGRGVQGPNDFQGYLAYQLTFGPAEKKEARASR